MPPNPYREAVFAPLPGASCHDKRHGGKQILRKQTAAWTPAAHLLVVRPGALGDAVLTLPALASLRAQGAGRIVLLGNPHGWGFLSATQNLLAIVDIDQARWLPLFGGTAPLSLAARALLRVEAAILYLSKAAALAGQLRRLDIARIHVVEPPGRGLRRPPHAATRLLRPFDGETAGALSPDDPLLAPSAAERQAVARHFPGSGRHLLLHPGSGGRGKCWPVERFAALASWAARQGLAGLALFGPADADLVAPFRQALADPADCAIAADLSLRDLLVLATAAAAYVGNDAGPTHLAALAAPTLALFGPTEPAVWRPLGKSVRVVRADDGELRRLAVGEVAAALERLLRTRFAAR